MKLIHLIVLVFVLSIFACAGNESEQKAEEQSEPQEMEVTANIVVDPVCGMKINKEDAVATAEHNGVTYYFCMEGDKDAFVEEPAKYLAKVDEPKVH